MATININVQIDNVAIERKLEELWTPETALECHNLLAKMCDPYVPFLHGPLSQSGMANVTPDGVTYNTPYARYQYYGTGFNHTLDFHPLASAMWDQAMLRDHRDEFVAQIKEILRRRIN